MFLEKIYDHLDVVANPDVNVTVVKCKHNSFFKAENTVNFFQKKRERKIQWMSLLARILGAHLSHLMFWFLHTRQLFRCHLLDFIQRLVCLHKCSRLDPLKKKFLFPLRKIKGRLEVKPFWLHCWLETPHTLISNGWKGVLVVYTCRPVYITSCIQDHACRWVHMNSRLNFSLLMKYVLSHGREKKQ